jgi:Kef-type K+ transport system membrane component KefB
MLAFVTLSALAGVEPILGAFIGGALVGFVLRQKQTLEGKIAALGNGLFIPVFFIVVGVRFDASALDRSMVLRALLLAALAGVAKLAPSLLLARRGTPLRARLAAGTLLAAPLTLVVAVAAIGRRLELIDSRQQAGLVLVAMLVSIVFPVLFKLLVREVRDEAATKRGIQKPSSVEKLHG